MGRRNRERVARIQAGLEVPIAVQRAAANPVGRQVLRAASHKGVVAELSAGSTLEQIDRLDSLAGTGALPPSRLKAAIMAKAPGEMDKAIRKFKKEGREITVEALCAEAKSDANFVRMCQNIGLPMEWFEALARERMEKHNL